MKRAKKVLAMILSLAMVMAMSLTAFAAPAPSEMPQAKVTVKSVVKGATVTAYQIIKYNTEGGYTQVSTNNPSDMSAPTAAEIAGIAGQITGGSTLYGTGTPLEYNETDKTYEGTVDAGMWIVLVSGSDKTIYNPMIVSVQVSPDGAEAGEVDADGHFNNDITLYAKSSTPEIIKTVADPAYEINDSLSFTVSTNIPAYNRDTYKSVTYNIVDTLDPELINNEDAQVKVNDVVVEPSTDTDKTYTITYNDAKTVMTINFDSGFALDHAGQAVEVKYSAKLTDEAKQSLSINGSDVNPTKNTVVLNYSNDPYDASKTTSENDTTNHYTFGIDASVLGKEGEIHRNFIKTESGVSANEEQIKWTEDAPLPGAEFELLDENFNKIDNIPNVKSDENGLTKFVGLDANKTYYLHEVKAPQGFSLIDKYVSVFVEAEFEGEEKDFALKDGWKIIIGEKILDKDKNELASEKKETGSYSWGTSEGKVETIINGNIENPFELKNTKLSELPSTGGIGTTIFTIGGCIIMIVAAGLFFASRRKKAEN